MSSNTIAKAILLIALITSSALASATEVIARHTIANSGEPAKSENPRCSDGSQIRTADAVITGMGVVIDSYIGVPLVSTALTDQRASNWVKVHLGLHDGPAICATLCLTTPRSASVNLYIGAHQNGGGDTRYIGPWEAPIAVGESKDAGIAWARFENVTKSSSASADVYCVVAKNWRASYSRDMWLKAVY